jgi:hypothetical protein
MTWYEINKVDGHGFDAMATPLCSRQWSRSQSEILSKNKFRLSCKMLDSNQN